MEVTVWGQWVGVGKGLELADSIKSGLKEHGLKRSEGLGSIPAVPYGLSTCSSLNLSFFIYTVGMKTHSPFRSWGSC